MIINPSYRSLLIFLLSAAAFPSLHAQELLEINTGQRCIYSGGLMDEELYRFSDSDRGGRLDKGTGRIGRCRPAILSGCRPMSKMCLPYSMAKNVICYKADFIEKSNRTEAWVPGA